MNSSNYRIVQTYSLKLTDSDVDKSIDIQVMRPLEAERSQFKVRPGHSIQDLHKACHITASCFYAYPSYEPKVLTKWSCDWELLGIVIHEKYSCMTCMSALP